MDQHTRDERTRARAELLTAIDYQVAAAPDEQDPAVLLLETVRGFLIEDARTEEGGDHGR